MAGHWLKIRWLQTVVDPSLQYVLPVACLTDAKNIAGGSEVLLRVAQARPVSFQVDREKKIGQRKLQVNSFAL